MIKPISFSDRLNLCLDKEGFPPKHKGRIQLLAQLVGLTHRGASKWLSGECRPPNKKFPILASLLNVNEKWLKTGVGSMYPDQAMFRCESMGVEQNVPIYPSEEVLATTPRAEKVISCILPYRGIFFGLFLREEAMLPRFPVGSLLILDRYAAAKEGDFILVSQDNSQQLLFRQFFTSVDGPSLHALDPEVETLIFTSRHDMIGKLIQAIVSF